MQAAYREGLGKLIKVIEIPIRRTALPPLPATSACSAATSVPAGDGMEQRRVALSRQNRFVAAAFEDFEFLIAQYVRAEPLAPSGDGSLDSDRMLAWLTANHQLTAQQRDHVVCQRAHYALARSASRNRVDYLHFEENSRGVDALLDRLETDPRLQIHLNPVRRWARFVTPCLLDGCAQPPANVILFLRHGQMATALLQLEGQTMINELADLQPCSLAEWSRYAQLVGPTQLADFCRRLAAIGLVCIS